MSAPRNAEYTKLYNKKTFLRLLRRTPLSRADAARALGLSRAAASLIAEELIREGLVMETPVSAMVRSGRPPIALSVSPDAAYAVGVYLNRDGCTAGVVSLSGEVISRARFRLEAEGKTDALCRSLSKLIEASGVEREKLLGVGISAPGPLDSARGVILNPPQFSLWHGTAIGAEVEEKMALPTLVENNAASLASYYIGKPDAKGSESFLLLLVDSGVGSGLVLKNKLFYGAGSDTGELGHVTVKHDGRMCACGNRGCLEAYAAIPALLTGSRFASWADVMNERLLAEDARDLFEEETEYLASAVVSAVNLLGIDTVLLAGDLRYEGEATARRMEETVKARLLRKEDKPFSVLPVRSDENTGLSAAAEIVFENYLRI